MNILFTYNFTIAKDYKMYDSWLWQDISKEMEL